MGRVGLSRELDHAALWAAWRSARCVTGEVSKVQTIREKIDFDAGRALVRAFTVNGNAADLSETLSDGITDALHALEKVIEIEPADGFTDVRRLVLRQAEVAISHYLCESHALHSEPDDDADGLGGYHNPNVRIAQADDGVPLYDTPSEAPKPWDGHRFLSSDTGMPCEKCMYGYSLHSDR